MEEKGTDVAELLGQHRYQLDPKGRIALPAKFRDAFAEGVFVTLGEDGMTLFRNRRKIQVKAEKHEVSDVTGAGDTVIATLAVMLAAGEGLESAVRIANRAGGIKVTKFGTAVVTTAETFAR